MNVSTIIWRKKRLVYIYSPYKELAGNGKKFDGTNDSSSFTSYTTKLVDHSIHVTKILDISNNFIDDLAKVYDRKHLTFMKYGNQWLIHKFDITKTCFEKIVKDKRTFNTSFNRFIYDEVLYELRTVLPAFFQRISKRRIKISNPGNFWNNYFVTKYYGTSDIFITPDLYSNANKSFIRNLSYVGYINVQGNLLQTFREILNGNEININRLYEFKCNTTTTVAIQEKDLVLLDFKFKVEFSDQKHRMKSK